MARTRSRTHKTRALEHARYSRSSCTVDAESLRQRPPFLSIARMSAFTGLHDFGIAFNPADRATPTAGAIGNPACRAVVHHTCTTSSASETSRAARTHGPSSVHHRTTSWAANGFNHGALLATASRIRQTLLLLLVVMVCPFSPCVSRPSSQEPENADAQAHQYSYDEVSDRSPHVELIHKEPRRSNTTAYASPNQR